MLTETQAIRARNGQPEADDLSQAMSLLRVQLHTLEKAVYGSSIAAMKGIVTGSLNSVVRARHAVSMPRHESVTDEYIEELKASLKAEAERVRTAPDWPETQKRMVTGLNAYQTALDRAEQGWSRAEIENELGVRTLFEKRPNPIRVIGNRTEEEDNG